MTLESSTLFFLHYRAAWRGQTTSAALHQPGLDTRHRQKAAERLSDREKYNSLVRWSKDRTLWPECKASCLEETRLIRLYSEAWRRQHHAEGTFFSSRKRETCRGRGKDECSNASVMITCFSRTGSDLPTGQRPEAQDNKASGQLCECPRVAQI